jgi:Tfp pilus assembly protein PilF
MLALFVWTAVHRNGRVRGAFFALAYFLVALLPILGLLKMSYMRAAWVADHFQYLADVGVIAFVCAGGALLWRRASPRRRCLLAAAASLLLVLFSTWSFLRAADYKDDYTLWADTVAKNPGTWQGQNRLGAELLARKEVQAATVHFAQAVRLKPDDADGHNNYGLGLASLGRFAESMEQFRASLQLQPAQFTAHANMGDALAQLKQPAEAAVEYKAALRYEPKLAPLHFRLAMVLLDSGKIDEAIASLEQAKALAPNSMEVLNALARATKKRAALR